MARFVMVLFGLVLLLPGACALGFMALGASMLPGLGRSDWGAAAYIGGMGLLLWGVCFIISYAGLQMIRKGLRKSP
jgi:hypothetical protein